MRHVSWTLRVSLDWLFDRINSDPKIQIKHVDTKNQLADKLTDNFTRDEWKNLLHLFIIIIFSLARCTEVMSKKNATKNKRREIIVALSKPTTNLVSHTAASSPTAQSSSASSRPGDTQSTQSAGFESQSTEMQR